MTGAITAQVSEILDRIAELNPSLNAFIAVFTQEAMADARALDEELRQGRPRGPLHGLTISIKDLIDVKGWPTTAASRVRAGHVADRDAAVVARLRQAGAIILGKTNLHEFALGTTTDESAFGPAFNPHDLTRSPGGSSGGSGAAVAAGLGWASIGTDTGGSIRIPAAACGIVGLKPTFGEIPTSGVVPLSVSLDHVGPMARSVRDVWTIFAELTGGAQPPAEPSQPAACRLGRLGGYFLAKLDAGVREQFEGAVERLASAGVAIDAADPGKLPDIGATYVNVALPEAYAVHARTLASMPDAYHPNVRARLEMGSRIARDDYMKAQAVRSRLRAIVDAALDGRDALVLPTLPIPAPKSGAVDVSIDGVDEPLRPLTLRLTQIFNLTGHPAITLPCGLTAGALPCGLQLVGRRHETTRLLQIALSCESTVTPPARSSSSRR